MTTVFEQIAEAVQKGEQNQTKELVLNALEDKQAPEAILNQGLISGMDVVGAKFQSGEFFIPHMLIAARAMQTALEVLKPRLVETGIKPIGKAVIGTVKNDHHDIGKNLVIIMLQGKGFEVVDLGIDVAAEQVVAAVGPDIQLVGLSALLSTTLPFMAETVSALNESRVRDRVKVIVGGGPVTQAFAEEIAADGYAPDAAQAADLALNLVTAG